MVAAAAVTFAPIASSAGDPGDPAGPTSTGDKSPTAAFLLSLVPTVAFTAGAIVASKQVDSDAVGLSLLAATVVTPSVGQWYAHDPGLIGLGLRLGGAGLIVAGFARGIALDDQGEESGDELAALGVVLYVGGVGFDLVSAPASARRYNRRQRAASALVVAPRVGAGELGLTVAGPL